MTSWVRGLALLAGVLSAPLAVASGRAAWASVQRARRHRRQAPLGHLTTQALAAQPPWRLPDHWPRPLQRDAHQRGAYERLARSKADVRRLVGEFLLVVSGAVIGTALQDVLHSDAATSLTLVCLPVILIAILLRQELAKYWDDVASVYARASPGHPR